MARGLCVDSSRTDSEPLGRLPTDPRVNAYSPPRCSGAGRPGSSGLALFHSALILTLPLSGVATLASLQTQASAQAAAATPAASGISWLAAGDSYSSGQGLPTTEPPCAQGDGLGVDGSTWSTVASEQLGIGSFEAGSPDLRACTGTISDQFFNNHGGGDDPQWSKSMGRYDLVSFSFGGNDIGFASIIQHCVIQGGCPLSPQCARRSQKLGTTGVYKGSFRIPPFPEFLTHVATSAVAHGGNVVVMGHPELIANPDDWPTGMTKCDGHFSKNTADEMKEAGPGTLTPPSAPL